MYPHATGARPIPLESVPNEDRHLFAVHLDAATHRFGDKQPARIIDLDGCWAPELLFPFQAVGALPLFHISALASSLSLPHLEIVASPVNGDKAPIRLEHLQPVVQPVGHVDHAILIHGDAGGTIELALTRA